jgi:cytochrome oxidase Cu insertion factor (SCO1/SenC/PrrC family)
MTRDPGVPPSAEPVRRATSGDPPTPHGAGQPPRRALRAATAAVALLGVVLAACSPNQAASRPAANTGAVAPKAGAAAGVQVGQAAPAFSLTMLDGKPLTSADLQAQQKPYILYFFATW